ncbi:hypothetical protein [uncultured Oscillibacter sp.]|uniref:hypothetical protein n=1 Tax=uncultured Oscillibacter sp. TaxID=876091 RepID=UPI0025E22932|nr:hypothetical protein [uncultured Oscillibacter sp.]
MYGVFLNPSSASAEQAGVILVFGLAAFGLLLLFNTYQKKTFKKGGGRTKRPKTPREKAVLVIGGVLAGLLLVMVLGMYLERT